MSYAGLGTADTDEELQATAVDPLLLESQPRVNPAQVVAVTPAPRSPETIPRPQVRCGSPISIGTNDPRLMSLAEIEQENQYLLAYRSQCYSRSQPALAELNEAIASRRNALLRAKRERLENRRKLGWYAAATVPGALLGAFAGHKSDQGTLPGAAVGAWANFVIFAAGTSLLMRILPARY